MFPYFSVRLHHFFSSNKGFQPKPRKICFCFLFLVPARFFTSKTFCWPVLFGKNGWPLATLGLCLFLVMWLLCLWFSRPCNFPGVARSLFCSLLRSPTYNVPLGYPPLMSLKSFWGFCHGTITHHSWSSLSHCTHHSSFLRSSWAVFFTNLWQIQIPCTFHCFWLLSIGMDTVTIPFSDIPMPHPFMVLWSLEGLEIWKWRERKEGNALIMAKLSFHNF